LEIKKNKIGNMSEKFKVIVKTIDGSTLNFEVDNDITILEMKKLISSNKEFSEYLYNDSKEYINSNKLENLSLEYDKCFYKANLKLIDIYEKENGRIPVEIFANLIINGKQFKDNKLKVIDCKGNNESIKIQLISINILKLN
jgi:hypothetical protein